MKRLILFSIAILVISCAEKLIQEPENLIPAEKMIDVLNDLSILSAAKTANNSTLDNSGIETMKFVFEKYGIDSTQFVASDRYYASQPVEYESIYSKVEVRLEAETKRRKEIKELKDSLKTVERDSSKTGNIGLDRVKENLSKSVQQ